jgi:hypothetical protein
LAYLPPLSGLARLEELLGDGCYVGHLTLLLCWDTASKIVHPCD